MDADIANDLNVVTLENLRSLAMDVSMEALASPGSLFNSRQKFGAFFASTRRFLGQMKLSALGASLLSPGETSAFLSSVSRVGYVDASNKLVTVPEGFVGKWVPYTEALRSAMQKGVTLPGEILAFNQTLGRIVNDPALLTSASGVGHATTGEIGLDAQLKDLGQQFFDGKTHHITRPLGTLIERSADIQTAHKTLNGVISTEKSVSPTHLLAATERTMVLGESLMALIDEKDKTTKASVQEIVGITLNLARELEAYGVLLFRIRQFHLSLKEAMQDMKK